MSVLDELVAGALEDQRTRELTVSLEDVKKATLAAPAPIDATRWLKRAYGIPVMKKYDEKDGTLGKVLFGTPSGGVGLYVPESMLEDARNLLAPVEESTRNEEES